MIVRPFRNGFEEIAIRRHAASPEDFLHGYILKQSVLSALKRPTQAALEQSHSQRLEGIFDQASADRGVNDRHGNPIRIVVSIHGLRVARTLAVA